MAAVAKGQTVKMPIRARFSPFKFTIQIQQFKPVYRPSSDMNFIIKFMTNSYSENFLYVISSSYFEILSDCLTKKKMERRKWDGASALTVTIKVLSALVKVVTSLVKCNHCCIFRQDLTNKYIHQACKELCYDM
jgi:hypothetical protein